MIVAQAALVWADDNFDREKFVATGEADGASDVIAYDPNTRAAVIAQWQNGG